MLLYGIKDCSADPLSLADIAYRTCKEEMHKTVRTRDRERSCAWQLQ
jgi:hypothetical protein